jgi:hypothetical protein
VSRMECLSIGCGQPATGRDQLCGVHRRGGGYLPGETLQLRDAATGRSVPVFLPMVPVGHVMTLLRDHTDGRSSWLGEFTSLTQARAWVLGGMVQLTPDTECISGATRLVDPAAAGPTPENR